MTLKKATPGPWRIGTPPPNGQQTIGTQGGLMVAVATTGLGMPTLANARLIATAPELLEFAKYVASLKTGGMIERRAKEVIAKAEVSDATE